MRRYLAIDVIGFLIFSGLVVVQVTAQESAQERAANLRTQLVETEARQAELQTRLQQLAEDLKPENIERSLAGVGSTHPEDLREARRRQLEIQKKSIESQLDILANSRAHLQAAIRSTDAEIYRRNIDTGAGPRPTEANNRSAISKSMRRQKKHPVRKRRSTKVTQTPKSSLISRKFNRMFCQRSAAVRLS